MLSDELHHAMVESSEIMGDFVTRGDTFGLFTLCETACDPADLVSDCRE